MKIDCDVIRDLLPLYAEDLASEKSRELVDEHLSDCAECASFLEELKTPDIKINHTAEPIQTLKQKLKKQKITVASLSSFITVSIVILLWGFFLMRPGDEMAYSLLCFYLFLPAAALICSSFIGKSESKTKWLAPPVFGAVGGILPYLIFGTFDIIFLVFAFIPAVIGLCVGLIIRYVKLNRK